MMLKFQITRLALVLVAVLLSVLSNHTVSALEQGMSEDCSETQTCGASTAYPLVPGVAADDDDEKDPMLQAMPIDVPPYYFDAYVRADISSFYREPQGSRTEKVPPDFSLGQAGKFINISPHPMDLFVEKVEGVPSFLVHLGPFKAGAGEYVSPPNTKFHFKQKDSGKIVCRFLTVAGTANYYYDPYVRAGDDEQYAAKQGTTMMSYNGVSPSSSPASSSQFPSLKMLTPAESKLYEAQRYNLKFATLYKNFTGGSEWLATYPPTKAPPYHKMWRADYFRQQHVVQTKETHFVEHPPLVNGVKYATKRNEASDSIAFPELRKPGEMNLTLTAVSCAPRAFQIDNFLSDVEADHILEVMQEYKETTHAPDMHSHIPKTAAERKEKVNDPETLVPRFASPIFDAVFRRVADVLQMDEALLRYRDPKEENPLDDDIYDFGKDDWKKLSPISERMRMIHYVENGTFPHHHDFGYGNLPSTRAINFCLYLNDVTEGGTTSFPRWRHDDSEEQTAMDMKPAKGRALFFYLTTPDNNLDDLSQHAGQSVSLGEKRFNNIWIWNQPIEEEGHTIVTD